MRGVLVIALLAATAATARELWVDRESRGGTCDDARPWAAVTASTPWCTLANAAQNVQPGDTVRVRGGVYTERHLCPSCDDTAVMQLVVAGTSAAPIRYLAEPGEAV